MGVVCTGTVSSFRTHQRQHTLSDGEQFNALLRAIVSVRVSAINCVAVIIDALLEFIIPIGFDITIKEERRLDVIVDGVREKKSDEEDERENGSANHDSSPKNCW